MKALRMTGHYNMLACAILGPCAFIAVSIRFLCRYSLKQKPIAADWLCVLSLLLFFGYIGVLLHDIFAASTTGEIDPLHVEKLKEAETLIEMIFITSLLISCTISAVKISILFLYNSIFAVNETFSRLVKITGVLCLIWFVMDIIFLVNECQPVDAFWLDLAQPHYCPLASSTWLGFEITNFLLDFVILALPLRILLTLHLSVSRKLSIVGIFPAGGIVCFASIYKTCSIVGYQMHPWKDYVSKILVCSTVQLGLAIIGACLPTFGPLFAFNGELFRKLKQRYGFMNFSKKSSSDGLEHLNWFGSGSDAPDSLHLSPWKSSSKTGNVGSVTTLHKPSGAKRAVEIV